MYWIVCDIIQYLLAKRAMHRLIIVRKYVWCFIY